MSTEADAICGVPYGEVSGERTNRRNGYRNRSFDTRVGTLDVAIRSCGRARATQAGCWSRAGHAEKALTAMIATSYLLGVSTRRVEKLVEALGIAKLSKLQVLRAG
jgi:transposase-like protein